MDCKTFDCKISDFIENKLENRELKAFIKHFDSCENCRSEFSADFYVYFGLQMLNGDVGLSYDIDGELKQRIYHAKHRLKRDKYVNFFISLFIIIAMIIVLFLIFKDEYKFFV